MSWVAKRRFVAVLDGKERRIDQGETLTDSEGKEIGLAAKPDLAKKKGPKTPKG